MAALYSDLAMKNLGVNNLKLLYSEVQGFEADLFAIAIAYFRRKRTDNVSVSTHNQRIHDHCISRLQQHGFYKLYDAIQCSTVLRCLYIFVIDRCVVACAKETCLVRAYYRYALQHIVTHAKAMIRQHYTVH